MFEEKKNFADFLAAALFLLNVNYIEMSTESEMDWIQSMV